MPKKKAKGKAKKASKATKKTEAEESLEAQTQRLKIENKTQDDDDAFLEDAMKLAAAEKKQLDAEKEKAAKLLMAENVITDVIHFPTTVLDS
jgi:stress response protein YsnF